MTELQSSGQVINKWLRAFWNFYLTNIKLSLSLTGKKNYRLIFWIDQADD